MNNGLLYEKLIDKVKEVPHNHNPDVKPHAS